MNNPLNKPFDLDGFTAVTATHEEAQEAVRKGRVAGADFVILSREPLEDGGVDEITLMVLSPEGNPLRKTFETMADEGLALRCNPLTRAEKQRQEARAKDSRRLHGRTEGGMA